MLAIVAACGSSGDGTTQSLVGSTDSEDSDTADDDGDDPDVQVAGTTTVPETTVPETTTTTAAPTTTTEPPAPAVADSMIFPTATWTEVDPADADFDGERLEDLAEAAEEIGSSCVTVTRNGRLIYQWHAAETEPDSEVEIFSATKSMSSTLVGIAQEQGLLDIDDKASDYITEWQGTPSEDVTIRNLISNDSGRYYDFQTDYVDMATGATDKTGFSVELEQQDEIGTTWVYNNSAIQTLEAVLQAAVGDEDVAAWGEEALLEPIGMTNSDWGTDAAGNAMTFMGVKSNCLDMARFGTLFLNNGNWDGEQVVPEAWVAEAVQPSQEHNLRYGFLWWLNTPIEPTEENELEANAGDVNLSWPSVGADAYAAQGLGGQVIQVQPETGIVLTRMGSVNNGNSSGALTTLGPIVMDAFSG